MNTVMYIDKTFYVTESCKGVFPSNLRGSFPRNSRYSQENWNKKPTRTTYLSKINSYSPYNLRRFFKRRLRSPHAKGLRTTRVMGLALIRSSAFDSCGRSASSSLLFSQLLCLKDLFGDRNEQTMKISVYCLYNLHLNLVFVT